MSSLKRTREVVDDGRPRKRVAVECTQQRPAHTEPASQLVELPSVQLMRSITAACALAGFDSIKPSALEMFRAQAEEYMLHFVREVRISMQGQRRARPTPQDFSMALSRTANTRAPRVLRRQLDLAIPSSVSCPVIADPDAAPAPAPDFTSLLQPLVETQPPQWIPKHFPQLPPQHAWKSTDVWPMRETDARKMREKATEEGMQAEQALRRLAAAAKASAVKADTKRNTALPPASRQRGTASREQSDEEIFNEVLRDIVERRAENGEDDRASKMQSEKLNVSESLLVNANASHWRGGKRQGLAF